MNNFWHFGDSFSFDNFDLELEWRQESNFGKIISNKLNFNYKFRSLTGISNEQIFNLILKENNNFKKGDIIFINWSFFSRGTYIDFYDEKYGILKNKEFELDYKVTQNLINSTNHWFDENHSKFNDDQVEFFEFIDNHKFMMDYILKHNFDFNIKLFNTVMIYFKTLFDKNIKVFNLFIRDNESLYYNNFEFDLSFKDSLGYVIEFEPSYFEWLEKNEYKGEKEGHYSKGIQNILAGEILKRMKTKMVEGLI